MKKMILSLLIGVATLGGVRGESIEERYRAIESLLLEAVHEHQIEPEAASEVLEHLREVMHSPERHHHDGEGRGPHASGPQERGEGWRGGHGGRGPHSGWAQRRMEAREHQEHQHAERMEREELEKRERIEECEQEERRKRMEQEEDERTERREEQRLKEKKPDKER